MSTASRRVRVARKKVEAQDICSFELVAVDGEALPAFTAGSHIDVHIDVHMGAPADGGLVRQYSLCNEAHSTGRYLIAVLLEPCSRGGSMAMHALEQGQEVRISDPKNHFALAHEASHHILLAGGIGITPLLCMAERLAATGASFELHYCSRSAQRAAFAGRIKSSAYADRVQFHFDDGAAEQKLDLAAVVNAAVPGAHLYVCGPTGFMDWVLATGRAAAWPEERLHREYFAAAPFDTSNDGSFEVQVASTGAVIRIGADQNVVQALAAHGVQIETSCEQGVCGTCLTKVIAGMPEHRDMFLTPDEQARGDQFTPCCSRSKSARLVLDL